MSAAAGPRPGLSSTAALAGAVAIAVAAALLLRSMGRPWICTCGEVVLWYPNVTGSGNSQHILDWYSPSHFTHGLVFFIALLPLRHRLGLPARALAAVALEAGWEILENTDWVLARYRAATVDIGYYGDSVLNSVSDIILAGLGFLFAARFGWKAAIAVGVALELLTLWTIRDNLTLNVLMLIWPIEALKAWQLAR